LHAPKHDHHIAQAQENFPDATIEPHKAHNEMLHRYLAGILGLCVLAIFFICFIGKQFRLWGSILLAVVIFQAALGMWTVTLNLLPMVVVAHLLGGFTLLCLLGLLRMEIQHANAKAPLATEEKLQRLLPFAYVVLLILIMQIALGGWTSANYAAVVCYQLPFCESGWQERFSLDAALSMPLGHETYEFGVLPYEARMSIHVMHRIGAVTTLLTLGFFCYWVWRCSGSVVPRRLAVVIGCILLLQCCLGLINITAQLPLINAVAHNFVAANLLMFTTILVRQLYLRRDHPIMVKTTFHSKLL
jgi:cytochrome c oxidase assembly protein subunit 15